MNVRTFTLLALMLMAIGVFGMLGCQRAADMLETPSVMPASDDTIKIGLIQRTDSYQSFGKGAKLAQAEINAAGGVMGKQIAFEERDNAGMDTAAIVEELQGMEVSAILGPIFSSNTLPLRSIVTVPLLPAANSRAITEENDFIFIAGAANDLQAKTIAAVAAAGSAKTAATIRIDPDAYSMIITDEFQKAFMALGGETVASETYASGDTDFMTQLTAIKAANPDVIFFASWPPEIPLAMKQARDMGITATFIGGDGWDEETLLTILDDNAPLEGGYYTANFSAETPGEKAQAFVAAYNAAEGRDPGGITAVGYDAVYLLARAIESAQSTDPVMIRDALAAITSYSGATDIDRFVNKIAIKDLVINTIKDGKIRRGNPELRTADPVTEDMPHTDESEGIPEDDMEVPPVPGMSEGDGETSGENVDGADTAGGDESNE